MDHTLNDPIAFRKAMLDNPQHMETFRKIYPPVVEAILSGSEEIYIEEFFKMRYFICYVCNLAKSKCLCKSCMCNCVIITRLAIIVCKHLCYHLTKL